MQISPLMLDLDSVTLSSEEVELVNHPLVGGVIFFSRNYESAEQIQHLVKQIRSATEREILIAVDHEGGRVQRFREQFTRLPSLASITAADSEGTNISQSLENLLRQAYAHGWLMAAEVRSVGIDFSFAPVLDLNYGVSEVIGDRSFHREPEQVARLATAYIEGMRDAGMASTGKHFPGHGAVREDSHLEIPIDDRSREAIWSNDLVPFRSLIKAGLDAVMPAHVIYPKVDNKPAGFSPIWLQQVLRDELAFDGVIFSDDLSMEGASVMGGFAERAEAAMEAGCDMVLVCNNRDGVIEVIDKANLAVSEQSSVRLQRMLGRSSMNRSALLDSKRWAETVEQVSALA